MTRSRTTGPWWLRIGTHALPFKGGMAVVLLLTLAIVGLQALKPWPLKLIVDHLLAGLPMPEILMPIRRIPGAGSTLGLLFWLAGATVVVFLLTEVTKTANTYLKAGLGRRMIFSLARELFSHVQVLSLQYHSRKRTGDLVQRITRDSRCVSDLIQGVALPMISALASLGVMFYIMWRLNWVLSLVAIFFALPLSVVTRLFYRPMTERRETQLAVESELTDHAERTLTAIPLVQSFQMEEYQTSLFRELADKLVRSYLRVVNSEILFRGSSSGIVGIGTAVVMTVGGFEVLAGRLTVGALLVFLAYVASLYAPIETLAYLSQSLAYASASSKRVLEVLDTADRVVERPGAEPLRKVENPGHAIIENVVFGYAPGRPVLKGVSLEVAPGQRIALVGATGVGKTTLVSMVPRFLDPWEGRVLLDGQDLRDYTIASVRDRVSLVLQDPYLLPVSIAENLAYGRPDATRAEIEAAAAVAQADLFIEQLPDGYETVVGERGMTLSGGQRQRIAIGRALLKDAPFLILDEPTAALDVETERSLIHALDRLSEGRTTFIIAHRLSTIRNADRIFVLQDGRVVEEGSHRELLQLGGVFARLWELAAGDTEGIGEIGYAASRAESGPST